LSKVEVLRNATNGLELCSKKFVLVVMFFCENINIMVILSLFSFLLAFAAVYGDWISFPITLPISGSQIIWTFENGFILKIGIVFQMILGNDAE